jgi:poly(3-hydroxyalkanoate) synthetase
VEGTDNQKQLPSAEAITEGLKIVIDTTTEDIGEAGSSQGGELIQTAWILLRKETMMIR